MNTVSDSTQLASSIIESIRQGHIEPGSFLPTVRQLSETHSIAHNTAWRALKALARQGYVEAEPRKGFRVVGNGIPGIKPVAYVMSRENVFGGWDLLYRNLLTCIEQQAVRKHSYVVKLIMNAGEEHGILNHLKNNSLSGLVIDHPNLKLLNWAECNALPAVVIDDWREDLKCDVVVQDNFAGGQLAVKHLLNKGCRRLAWFGYSLHHYHGQLRYSGSRTAIAAAGKTFASERFLKIDDPGLLQAAMDLLSRADRPDGILALWRPMTFAIAKAAQRLGLKMGSDLHVVGWINEEAMEEGYLSEFDEGHAPPAVVWKAADMAEVAMSALPLRHADPKRPLVCHQVPVRLWQSP